MGRAKRVNIITMGCSKNLVDSEVLMKQLHSNTWNVKHESDHGKFDVVIINTCGFIGDAKEESIEMILNAVEEKKTGKIGKVVVIGCLSERYKKDLKNEIPEVDGFYGTDEVKQILLDLGLEYFPDLIQNRIITTPGHYEYLKISEGCDRTCSFCAIPMIRGKHHSKPVETLIAESRFLAKKGVKELILIAQDLSYYGIDLYKKRELASLLESLSQVDGIEWIRLHYAYPAQFPIEILPVINNNSKVCKYIDIAFQHVSDRMLMKMRRNFTKTDTFSLIETIRREVPGIALRTSLMVGHPGELEDDFNELLQFVKDIRFERLGVFTYSHEEDTYSYFNFEDDISEEIKQYRKDELMNVQQAISRSLNQEKVGKVIRVLIDRHESAYSVGRTEYDSPEIDNEVIVSDPDLKTGEFYTVKISSADEFDLYGEIAN